MEKEKSTAMLTKEFIDNHPQIKSCLKHNLINFSSLSEYISKEIKLNKKSNKQAISIAAIRYQKEILKESQQNEINALKLLKSSEFESKNKITLITIEKEIKLSTITKIQELIFSKKGVFYLLQGDSFYSLIFQDKYLDLVNEFIDPKYILNQYSSSIALIIKSEPTVEQTIGFISYLSSLFSENGVNIKEIFSFWTNTLIIIDKENFQKAIKLIDFN